MVGSLIQVLLPWSVTQSGASVGMTGLEALLIKVLLVGWLVAGSEEDRWQSVVGSLIEVGIIDIALWGPHLVDVGVGVASQKPPIALFILP
jgi:hypothetical protein